MKPLTIFLLAAAIAVGGFSAAAQPRVPAMPARPSDAPRVGDAAPDFSLKSKDGQREVRLSSFKGQRPVVLVFGSFT